MQRGRCTNVGRDEIYATVLIELAIRSGFIDHIISALRDDNSTPSLEVADRGWFVSVRARHILRISQRSLQWHLGPNFGILEFEEMVMLQVGFVTRTPEELAWRARRHLATVPDFAVRAAGQQEN